MKQTAVEWLIDKYIIVGGITQTMVEQAKEMEKEQIIETMDRMGNTDFYCEFDSPEQYYNETFKSE